MTRFQNPGPPGPQGPIGPIGPIGPTGASGIEWQGVWDANAEYAPNDAVFYDNSSWFASTAPPVGDIPSQESEYWFPLALQGATGAPGEPGEPGAPGEAGPPGPPTYAVISATQPASPEQGELWFNSATAETFIYYEDETSAQWVQIAPYFTGS